MVGNNLLAVQNISEIIIYNFISNTIDFRINFASSDVYEMTFSMGLMAIGRYRKSLLYKFDDPSIDHFSQFKSSIDAKKTRQYEK